MRSFVFTVLFLFAISCNNSENKSVHIKKDTNCVDNENIQVNPNSIGVSKELLHHLDLFMQEVDTIHNPFNKSVKYSIFLKKDYEIITMRAYIDYFRIINSSSTQLKGFFRYKNKKIAVYDGKGSSGNEFYKENNLLTPANEVKEDSVFDKWSKKNEGWTYVPPYVTYRIEDGQFIEIDKYIE